MLENGSWSPPDPNSEAAMPILGLGAWPFLCGDVEGDCNEDAEALVSWSAVEGEATVVDDASTEEAGLSSEIGGELLMLCVEGWLALVLPREQVCCVGLLGCSESRLLRSSSNAGASR